MSILITGGIILFCLFGFIYLLVRASKQFEEQQKKGKQKKINKDIHKGGLK